MQILSQRDGRWSEVFLGKSSLTIGRYGCTTTCISMLSDYFGCFTRPDEIAKNTKNYTKDGLVIWGNLKFPRMEFVWREYGRNDANIKAALKDPNKAVILQVNHGQHWVVALSPTIFGNDYRIADPWMGDKSTACGRYHDITGAAYFRRA